MNREFRDYMAGVLVIALPLMAAYFVLVVIGDAVAGPAGIVTMQLAFIAALLVTMRRMSR